MLRLRKYDLKVQYIPGKWHILQGWPSSKEMCSQETKSFWNIRAELSVADDLIFLLPIFNHSCHSTAVCIVPGVITQIINTLLFLLSVHPSSSQSNILITALPLMLLRSGINSLMMCAVQHQLPPSKRSLKLTCLQKHIPHSLSCHPVSHWLCPQINVNCFEESISDGD